MCDINKNKGNLRVFTENDRNGVEGSKSYE